MCNHIKLFDDVWILDLNAVPCILSEEEKLHYLKALVRQQEARLAPLCFFRGD